MLSDLGTDIKNTWTFKNGDLILVSEIDNIIQSILSRLQTMKGEMDAYYNDYGGYLRNYFGVKKETKILGFIQTEVTTILKQDPRLQDITVNVSFGTGKDFIIELDGSFDDDTDLSLSLVLNDEVGVSILGS